MNQLNAELLHFSCLCLNVRKYWVEKHWLSKALCWYCLLSWWIFDAYCFLSEQSHVCLRTYLKAFDFFLRSWKSIFRSCIWTHKIKLVPREELDYLLLQESVGDKTHFYCSFEFFIRQRKKLSFVEWENNCVLVVLPTEPRGFLHWQTLLILKFHYPSTVLSVSPW